MPKPAAQAQYLQQPGWQQQLARAITDSDELLARLRLDAGEFAGHPAAARDFPLRVTHSYLAKMRPGDPRDPLLLQVMASADELRETPGFSHDPVGDLAAMAVPGLLHKYHGRVLLVTTAACAVHCRYCFRRHFPYEDNQSSRNQWQQALEYIAADSSISEVILSGGDPLVLSDRRLEQLTVQLQAIPHVRRLRIHSRLPVVLPERITDELVTLLGNSRLQCSLVVHANHANEIADEDIPRLQRLAAAGVCLLNQAVLLRQVNDSARAQAELSERLFEAGVLPYYLHLLDPVQGAGHFHVTDMRAMEIIGELRAQLPGYLVPRLVREIAGEKSKTPTFGL
jgi:EF-P beta-lysylation protein EpmB